VLKADQRYAQNPSFLNAAGKFDLNKFKDYFKAIPEGIKMLREEEKNAELNAKYQIYNSLVKGAMYTTASEGKFKYESETNKVNFDFVMVQYASIKDSDVKVTDDEIVAYMKTKEKKFKSEESRELDYVLIQEKPSAQDEAEIKSNIDKLLTTHVEFKDGKNDTTYLLKRTPLFNGQFEEQFRVINKSEKEMVLEENGWGFENTNSRDKLHFSKQ
jgi:peptidyl-prolyl cis-trans isomerase D